MRIVLNIGRLGKVVNVYSVEVFQFFCYYRFEALNTEYDDYQKQSSELEIELETQLKQTEDRIRDLENKNNRLNIDNDTLKVD
jgi:hypothetical protein